MKGVSDWEKGKDYSEWILVTSNHAFLKDPFVNFRVEPCPTLREILWTDDYSPPAKTVRPYSRRGIKMV